MKWRAWVRGLIAAINGGAMTGAATLLAAPPQEPSAAYMKQVLWVAGVGAFVALMHYLEQSPIPGDTNGTNGKG